MVLSVVERPRCQPSGDLWQLGGHRLLCADARKEADVTTVMGGPSPAAVFSDPPYNVRIGSIVGRGRKRHPEFQMASGEMARAEFIEFLVETLGPAARACKDGALGYVCMDWRHIAQLIEAGDQVYGAMLNLVTWVKTNAGQGSFYRSQHELIGVFRCGSTPHLNNIELRMSRPVSFQRLALRRCQHLPRWKACRSQSSPDGQAGCVGGGCHQGRHKSR